MLSGPLSAAWPPLTPELLRPPEDCLPVPPARDRGVWAAVQLPGLRERAAADRRAPWPVPLASGYARYFRDGDRDAYEQVVFARQQRLSRAAVLAAVTLGEDWIDDVADGVTLLCEQSTWCWPAHDDTYRRHGSVLPTITDPYLDLGAGEVAAQLAWIDHLLGEQLATRVPGLRERIRYEVDRRVLTPFVTRRDWHWLGLDGDVHNWSPWIQGNVLVAALRLETDAARRTALIDLTVAGLDRYADALPADGAIDEGYGYWWNGACRLLEAADVLAYATRGVMGDLPAGPLWQTVSFPHRMHLGGPWHLNHADSSARPSPDLPWAALHRAARRVGDRDAEAYAAAHHRPPHENEGLGRLLRALTDPAWLAAEPGPAPLPREVWLSSTQVLVARPEAGSAAGLTLAVKGGHNGEHHNHDDVGSVVVAVDGAPVLVDAGRPTYTAQTFGPDRYRIWTMRSDWHNVPTIRGTLQGHGREYAARSVRAGDDGMVLDLAGAYPRTDVRSWLRTTRLDRATGRVTVRDAWLLDPADDPEPTVLHLLLAGPVTLGAGRADVAGVLRLTWNPPVPAGLVIRELGDPLLREVWGPRLTRLDIDVTALGPIGSLELTCEEHR